MSCCRIITPCACSARAAIGAQEIIASDTCRRDDPRARPGGLGLRVRALSPPVPGGGSIPGLTWPTLTFQRKMTLYLGKRHVDLMHLGRAHTAGDIVAHVPDAGVMLTGDIVEYRSACYCGDAHFQRLAGDARRPRAASRRKHRAGPRRRADRPRHGRRGARLTRDFVASTYAPAARVAASGGSLKEALGRGARRPAIRNSRPTRIYEHCLPFNVARAYDEAIGIDTPRIWTAARDKEMWDAYRPEHDRQTAKPGRAGKDRRHNR